MPPSEARNQRPTQHVRRVKLFRDGRNQAVRIPVEFELPGEEALLRREGTGWCSSRSSGVPSRRFSRRSNPWTRSSLTSTPACRRRATSTFDIAALHARHEHRVGPRPQSGGRRRAQDRRSRRLRTGGQHYRRRRASIRRREAGVGRHDPADRRDSLRIARHAVREPGRCRIRDHPCGARASGPSDRGNDLLVAAHAVTLGSRSSRAISPNSHACRASGP